MKGDGSIGYDIAPPRSSEAKPAPPKDVIAHSPRPSPHPAPSDAPSGDPSRGRTDVEDDFGKVSGGKAAVVGEEPEEGAVGSAEAPGGDRRRRADKRRGGAVRPPRPSGVKAGAADDNLQFNAYLRFLDGNKGQGLPFDPSTRRVVSVRDKNDRPWPGVTIELREGGATRGRRMTYADGRTLLFPPDLPGGVLSQRWSVRVTAPGRKPVTVPLTHRHSVDVKLSAPRPEVKPVPLDIAFVLDTTGSMQDEINQLRDTLNTINFQVSNTSPRPAVRYGMVLFRDRGEAYRTRVIPFTDDLDPFSRALEEVSAGGGDDYPEDVQAGLEAALHELRWRESGVKVAFLIGDAPPHLDYGQRFTYLNAADEAAARGIKIATIGASGLDKTGEVVWRQLAQQTMGPFVFLTYGEKGDAEGSPSSVSHHVGANWVADDLDAIVVRLVKQELAHWRPRGAPKREDFFIATRTDRQPSADVLEELFAKSAQQLVDYAVESIEPRTPTVVLPLRASDKKRARMLERRLAVGLSRQGRFQLIEKDRSADVLTAIADQMARSYDEQRMVEVGKLVPARLAVLGTVDGGDADRLELLVKLVRLETGEVLSLSLLKIDEALL